MKRFQEFRMAGGREYVDSLYWPGDEKSLRQAVVEQWSEIFPGLDYGGSEVAICHMPRLRADLLGYDQDGNITVIELKGPGDWDIYDAWEQLAEYMRVGCASLGILAAPWELAETHKRCPGGRYVNLLRTALRAPDGKPYKEHWEQMVEGRKELFRDIERCTQHLRRAPLGPRTRSEDWATLEAAVVSRY